MDTSGTLNAPLASVLLAVAAILGNTLNYSIGRAIGPPRLQRPLRFLKVDYLRRTEAFFQKYGGMTIVVSRFMPIVRTFAPFVAGVGRMPYARFQGLQHRGRRVLGDAVRVGRLPVRQHSRS